MTSLPFQTIHHPGFTPGISLQLPDRPIQVHLTHAQPPVILRPRTLEADERTLIDRHKRNWSTRSLPGRGTKLYKTISSPFGAGIRYTILGGFLGVLGGLVLVLSKKKDEKIKWPLVTAVGAIVSFFAARLGYLLQRRRNEETIWLIRSLPYKDACIGDAEQLPAQKAELDRQAWIRAARGGASSLSTSLQSFMTHEQTKRENQELTKKIKEFSKEI
jgi:hypothetical protein